MTFIDKPPHSGNDPEHDRRILHEMQDMFAALTEITQRHAKAIPGGIFSLDDEVQQAFINDINPYFRFEFAKYPDLLNLPVTVTGNGMFFLSDFEGNLIGAERIGDRDIVSGRIAEVCAFPTPPVGCLAEVEDGNIPVSDQVLSPILILQGARFKTGLTDSGEYEAEYDLVGQTGLPLLHYLRITNAS